MKGTQNDWLQLRAVRFSCASQAFGITHQVLAGTLTGQVCASEARAQDARPDRASRPAVLLSAGPPSGVAVAPEGPARCAVRTGVATSTESG